GGERDYYRAAHAGLRDLGLEPHLLSGSLLNSLLEIALRYRDRVRREVILPGVDWRVPGGCPPPQTRSYGSTSFFYSSSAQRAVMPALYSSPAPPTAPPPRP